MTCSCVAIVCVRNEESYVESSISAFLEQNVEVVIIDHESTDNTRGICQQFLGHGLLKLDSMPWEGEFNLAKQLEKKKIVEGSLTHDWIIHADADEWLLSNIPGETLTEGLDRVSRMGFNVVNFEEFVFLPASDKPGTLADIRRDILTYYFFEPGKLRLMRAWKRNIEVSNVFSGGHKLQGSHIKISPEPFLLRHYLVLSQQYALRKYVGRPFSPNEVNRGWHRNRINLTEGQLKLPFSQELKKLDHWESRNFDRSDPKKNHFWEWGASNPRRSDD